MDHELFKLICPANVMTSPLLQDTRLIGFFKSLGHYSKSFQSSYHAIFDEARTSSICKNLVPSGLLQGAVEATYRRYISVTIQRLQCPEDFRLFETVNDEATASNSAARKSRLAITHFNGAMLLESGKQDPLRLFEAAAGRTKSSTKEITTAALSSSRAFF